MMFLGFVVGALIGYWIGSLIADAEWWFGKKKK